LGGGSPGRCTDQQIAVDVTLGRFRLKRQWHRFPASVDLATHNKLSDLLVVSGLKEKASQAKNASIKSYGSARERLSTHGTSGDSTTKAKPPPPPPRRAPSSSKKAFGGPSRGVVDDERIDWANLSDEDKQAFFAWLDEFFAQYLGLPQPATVTALPIPSAPVSAETSGGNTVTSVPSPRSSPSLPPRRVNSRASRNSGPDPPDEAAPAQVASVPARRNLPPSLSQEGPVCLYF
jgi:hypothetical protein